MAETTVQGNGNGRERFEGTVGGQKFTVSVRDLLPVLILLAAVAGGFLLYQQVSFAVRALYRQNILLEDRLVDNYREFMRVLTVMEWNCRHEEDYRLPLVLDPSLLQKTLPDATPQQ